MRALECTPQQHHQSVYVYRPYVYIQQCQHHQQVALACQLYLLKARGLLILHYLATPRLAQHLHNAAIRLNAEEAEPGTKVPRLLNPKAFKHLFGRVTLCAIDYIKREWEAANKLQNEEGLDS